MRFCFKTASSSARTLGAGLCDGNADQHIRRNSLVTTIASLVLENEKLCGKLHRFSPVGAMRLVASLGVLPQFHANTIRLEVLTHLAAIACTGSAEPSRDNLAEWLRQFGQDSSARTAEDPVEDVFVGCVNTTLGSFRLFSGNFTDGYFIVERLFSFLAAKATFPTFQESINGTLALLRLSDALASRCGLKRNTQGSGQSAGRMAPPRWRELQPSFAALFFSTADLRHLEVPLEALEEFCFTESHRKALPGERLWNSSLERHPLVRVDDGIVIAEPSTLARTIARYVVERVMITQMGRWADTFYHQENATIFVNEVGKHLGIEPIKFEAPTSPERLPPLLPFFGRFDVGKPVIMLTHTGQFAPAATDFDGFDKLSQEEQLALDAYIQSCATQLEKSADFSGGMVLVCIAGVGRGVSFSITPWNDRWHVHLAPLHDWLILAADSEFSALRLWKLAEQETLLANYNTDFLNPSGLVALWDFWRRSEFWLVPKDFDIHNPRNLLVIGTDFAIGPRLEAKLRHDIHCVPSHDGTSWLTMRRLNPLSLFGEDKDSRIYADPVAAREHRLVGCVEGDHTMWWVIAPQIDAPWSHLDVLYQLWECVLQWTERASAPIEGQFGGIRSVEICLEFPDFARWDFQQQRVEGEPSVVPIVNVRRAAAAVTLTMPERFLAEFNQPKNIAEQKIVSALITSIEQLCDKHLIEKDRTGLVREIMGNEDARFFHIVETRLTEQMVKSPFRAKPFFIGDEDLAFAQIGLADLAGPPARADTLKGKSDCQSFLDKIVAKLWERVEQRLRPFDRRSVAASCFAAIDEIALDAAHWNLTTRSLLALHVDRPGTMGVLSARRHQRDAAMVCNRISIETAQYSAAGDKRFNRAEHAKLLADLDLLITMAHHRDATAYGFVDQVGIHPRGDIEIDEAFYRTVMTRYMSRRSDKQTEKADRGYDSHFRKQHQSDAVITETELVQFGEAFAEEYGFTVQQLVEISNTWREVAIHSSRTRRVITENEMFEILAKGASMTRVQTESFLDRFTLPIRSARNSDLPRNCSTEDVFPWRFRRHLSLLMRPLVEISEQPRTWFVSAPSFEQATKYITGSIHEGRLPDQFFRSAKMRSYIGTMRNQHGHAFTERVAVALRPNVSDLRVEVRMTEFGAPANPDLGDVDIFAWTISSGIVFLIECKRLTPALTVREVILRLEEFRGDERKNDSLRKHIRRVNWLEQNRFGVERITRIPAADIVFHPLLVTSESVPMQFFEEMKFPTQQVVPVDELIDYVLRVGNAP